MENEKMVTVPYSDFVKGVCAIQDLDSIRAMIYSGSGYCSDGIKAVLGIEINKNDG